MTSGDPRCGYCDMETFSVIAGWFCVKCHSSLGKANDGHPQEKPTEGQA